jgi:hypothetical protein
MKEIYSAFVRAQAMIAKAAKDSTNPHFKSKYADLESVIDAVKPALIANGLAFIQKYHDCEDGVKVETVIIHESGQELSCGILHIPANKKDAQGFGSASSYAKRYSLQSALGVAASDDDGNLAVKSVQVKTGLDLEKVDTEILACKTEEEVRLVGKKYWGAASKEEKAHIQALIEGVKEELKLKGE